MWENIMHSNRHIASEICSHSPVPSPCIPVYGWAPPSLSQKCSQVALVMRLPVQLCAISCATTLTRLRSPAMSVGVTALQGISEQEPFTLTQHEFNRAMTRPSSASLPRSEILTARIWQRQSGPLEQTRKHVCMCQESPHSVHLYVLHTLW